MNSMGFAFQNFSLKNFGIDNIKLWYTPYWLGKLSKLLFEINNTNGTPGSPKKEKVKPAYRQYGRELPQKRNFK